MSNNITTKEKEELREKLIDKIPDYSINMPNEKIGFFIKKTEAEYLLKALEAFERQQLDSEWKELENSDLAKLMVLEQPLPLDAGEFYEQVTNDGAGGFYDTGYDGYDVDHMVKFAQDFAQASITAKQREWDKEKAELVDAAKVAYELVPGFLRDSSLVKKVKMTISKYTNQ